MFISYAEGTLMLLIGCIIPIFLTRKISRYSALAIIKWVMAIIISLKCPLKDKLTLKLGL
jgi:C4-dicarboxylate transporter